MAVAQRTKLSLRDLGEGAMIKTLPEDQMKYIIGTLYVMASKIIERKNPKAGGDGEPDTFEGLGGQFRMVPADPKREPLESGVLFIPDSFHNMISAAMKNAQGDDPNAEMLIAFEVASVRAKNPQGYTWQFTPMVERAENPMDNFVAAIANSKQAQIAAPKSAAADGGKKK